MKIDHEIISMAILLSLPVIQVGQLSVIGKRMCTVVNCFGISLPRKSVDRLTDRLDMTIVVYWGIKQHSNKQNIWIISVLFLHTAKCIISILKPDRLIQL